MVDLPAISDAERRYCEGGQPSLGEAFVLLRQRWAEGARDRETGLRVMFLAWYSCGEPPFLTGLPAEKAYGDLFCAVFQELGCEGSSDPELLFAVGVMASSFPWCIGQVAAWEVIGNQCLNRARELRPDGFDAASFEGRGAYGDYFAHLIRNVGWERLTGSDGRR